MPIFSLSESDVRAIKRRLWNGEAQHDIAADYEICTSQISNICAGYKWDYVPWPDGSTGAMPAERRKKIVSARREATRGGGLRSRVKKLLEGK